MGREVKPINIIVQYLFLNNIFKNLKMKSLTAFVCVVVVSSICHFAKSDSQIADSDAAADYYAQYYKDYYNSLEAKNVAERDTGYHEPEYHETSYHEPSYGYSTETDTFDYHSAAADMFGPDPALPIALISLLGLIGVGLHNIFQQIQIEDLRSRTDTLEDRQAEICTAVRSITSITGTPATSNVALWEALINIASPACN